VQVAASPNHVSLTHPPPNKASGKKRKKTMAFCIEAAFVVSREIQI